MKRYGLALSIGLVLLVNIFVFSGIIYNRSGKFDAEVTLTEREVPLTRAQKENTGLFLKLDWEMSGSYQFEEFKSKINWLNEDKLKQLGYEFPSQINSSNVYKFDKYNAKFPPSKTFIVLEFNGKSWQDWLKDHRKDLQSIALKIEGEKNDTQKKNLEKILKQRKRLPLIKSRLFAIDAGNHPDKLRKAYPNRAQYIITPGVIKVNYTRRYKGNTKTHPGIQGRIRRLFPKEIFVPNSYRTFFEKLKSPRYGSYYYVPESKSDSEILPQYEVTLNFGKKYETWITGVNSLNKIN